MSALVNYIGIPERKTIQNEFVSKRNNRNAYEIPYEKNKVVLIIEPEKVIISDNNIKQTIDYEFTYFTPEVSNFNPITLLEGTIFRGISSTPKELLQYYIIKDNSVVAIPNYKTVEVLLSERGKPIDSVTVLEDKDLNEILASNNGQIDLKQLELDKTNPKSPDNIPAGGGGGGGGGGGSKPPTPTIESKEEEWKPDMSQEALAETFNSLLTTVTAAEDIAQSAVDTAKQTIDLAIANANKAEQESATAQTEAAAAIASAQQAEAEAQLLTSDQVSTLETVITDLDALEVRVDNIEAKK